MQWSRHHPLDLVPPEMSVRVVDLMKRSTGDVWIRKPQTTSRITSGPTRPRARTIPRKSTVEYIAMRRRAEITIK